MNTETLEHSKGPWVLRGRYIEANGWTVCDVIGSPFIPEAERKANRRLILSAPKMLKALEDALHNLGQVKTDPDSHNDRFIGATEVLLSEAIKEARLND